MTIDDLYETRYDGEVRRAAILLGSPTVAHDVVADAFCAVIRRWDTIHDPPAYLSRAVLHGCQRAGTERAREVASSQESLAVGPGGEDRAHADEPNELIDAVRRLPWPQGAVVVLKFYEGLTERQIAERLEIRPGSVGPTLTRAMRQLRKEIER